MKNYQKKACSLCSTDFQPNSSSQKFCGDCAVINKAQWFQKRDHLRRKDDSKRPAMRAAQKRYWQRTKLAALQAYGGLCACCGEQNVKFLTIDHINSDGAEHRRQTNGRSQKIYRWLKANHYPDGFRVLCYNCNCGRAMNGGTCPHEEMVTHE